jgi:HEAT repeat protein|tara:strand:+ start:186 stop:737 length:552 start_codon:yes stop_codon:yes gene_type:complete
MNESVRIHQILDSGSNKDKISILESLSQSTDQKTINKIISKLDDSEIQIRGEAFSSLLLNKNDISEFLIDALSSESKNIRGFSALVLANRGDSNVIPSIESLAEDSSDMVRSCAIGALGHLHSTRSTTIIRKCFQDKVLEVRKSAVQAFLKIEGNILPREIDELTKDADEELKFLITKVSKNM